MKKTCENEKCKKRFNTNNEKSKFCCFDCYLENKKNTKNYPGIFKKGNKPTNYIKIGRIIIKREIKLKGKPLFNFIKIGNKKYCRYDKYIWEKHYGKKIPRGLRIKHIDGDLFNDNIDNLEIVTSFGNKAFKSCLMCGANFRAKKNHHQIYCSKECSNKGRKSTLRKICKNTSCLNKEFKPKHKHQKYCSKDCMNKGTTNRPGKIVIRKEGGYKFHFLKISNKKLIRYDKYMFEKHYNEKIICGTIIKHKDGDTLNDNIDNLELITNRGNKVIKIKCSNPNCNKEFTKNKIRHKYCCRDCYDKTNRKNAEIHLCENENCKKEFIIKGWRKRFCSIECFKKHKSNYQGKVRIRKIKNSKYPRRFTFDNLKGWVLTSDYLWEQKFGKIPEGYIVGFKDGESFNDQDIHNLKLIAKSDLV